MSATFYITTPIYYVNDNPHIGHADATILPWLAGTGRILAGREIAFPADAMCYINVCQQGWGENGGRTK